MVQRIFLMKKDGMSNAAIARALTAEQVPNPNYHRYLQGVIFTKRFSENMEQNSTCLFNSSNIFLEDALKKIYKFVVLSGNRYLCI